MKKFSIAAVFFLLPGLCGAVWASASEEAATTVLLAPAIRSGALQQALPQSFFPRSGAFVSALPVAVDAAMLDHAPRIVSAPEQRMHLGKGDRMYVEGDVQGAAEFLIVRSTQRLRDPVSGEHLGDEVMQLGAAKLVRKAGDGLHAFFISDSRQEIVIGDRLLPHLPKSDESLAAGAPRNPGAALDALIVSVSDGAVHAAQHQVVSINKGARDQLMEGASFALYATADKLRRETKEQTPEQEPRLPEEESGRLLILRVFERVSYGLITQAVAPLRVGDKARAPH